MTNEMTLLRLDKDELKTYMIYNNICFNSVKWLFTACIFFPNMFKVNNFKIIKLKSKPLGFYTTLYEKQIK